MKSQMPRVLTFAANVVSLPGAVSLGKFCGINAIHSVELICEVIYLSIYLWHLYSATSM